jgi:hypothetical protein
MLGNEEIGKVDSLWKGSSSSKDVAQGEEKQ